MRLIDADFVRLRMDRLLHEYSLSENYTAKIVAELCVAFLDATPTVEAAPVVHAHWIITTFPDGEIAKCVCSNPKCGRMSPTNFYFCPNCGAKMDEEIHDTESLS